MQLLIILALLLYGGKSNADNIIEEVKPVLETIGGEDMKQALKSAEEISEVLSAVQGLAKTASAQSAAPQSFAAREQPSAAPESPLSPRFSFPLAPISAIADREITYSLSKYFSAE